MGRKKHIKKLLNTADILPLLKDISADRQEHFLVLSVDSGRRLITKRVVFIGTVDTVIAHPREVYAGAVADFATGIIVAHNHPSGDPTPSKQDIATTQQLVAAGAKYFSFAAEGMIFRKRSLG